MRVTLTLDDEARKTLAARTAEEAVKMREQIAGGERQANRHVAYQGGAGFGFYYYQGGRNLLVHVRYTRKLGWKMFYHTDLAAPGSDVWNVVHAALEKVGG